MMTEKQIQDLHNVLANHTEGIDHHTEMLEAHESRLDVQAQAIGVLGDAMHRIIATAIARFAEMAGVPKERYQSVVAELDADWMKEAKVLDSLRPIDDVPPEF